MELKPTETFSQSIRGNPQHFFTFLHKYKERNPSISPFLEAQGLISGDSHPGQWSFVPRGNRFFYSLIDFDMSGQGPLVVDVMQYALNIRTILIQRSKSKYDIPTIDLVNSYLKGLGREQQEAPQWVQDILHKDEHSFYKKQQKYYRKKTDGTGLLEIADNFERVTDLSLQEQIEMTLKKNSTFQDLVIDDMASKKIDRGGSAGLGRYWVLAHNKSQPDQIAIYELKERQVGILARSPTGFDQMYRNYWGEIPKKEYFSVEINNLIFDVRPKKISLDEGDIPYNLNSHKELEFLWEKSVYDMYLMGVAHSNSASAKGLRDVIEGQSDSLAALIDLFATEYIKDAKKSHFP